MTRQAVRDVREWFTVWVRVIPSGQKAPFRGEVQTPGEQDGKVPTMPPFRSTVRGGTVLIRPVRVNVECPAVPALPDWLHENLNLDSDWLSEM